MLEEHLPNRNLMVLAVNWRTGELLELMPKDRGTSLAQILSRVMTVGTAWKIS